MDDTLKYIKLYIDKRNNWDAIFDVSITYDCESHYIVNYKYLRKGDRRRIYSSDTIIDKLNFLQFSRNNKISIIHG